MTLKPNQSATMTFVVSQSSAGSHGFRVWPLTGTLTVSN